MDDLPKQKQVVLFKDCENHYRTALVEQVHEDGSLDLTIYGPGTHVFQGFKIKQGGEAGQWSHTGVDAVSSET